MSIVVPPPIQTGVITDDVLTTFATLGFPVGDGQVPPGANWVGQPFLPSSTFEPYMVVSEIAASHSSGSLGDSQSEWQLPYLIEYFGISREACRWLADKARSLLPGLRTHTFTIDTTTYGLQQVRLDSIGSPVRVEAVYPPVWHAQDGITLWLAKGA